ncbi:MAG: hypothetical protein LBH46_03150 [Rickettsiales bacterium]|jgi:hypothetical protein|nr:hypothetical protein [Rickettsiales bacterium]
MKKVILLVLLLSACKTYDYTVSSDPKSELLPLVASNKQFVSAKTKTAKINVCKRNIVKICKAQFKDDATSLKSCDDKAFTDSVCQASVK